MSIKQKVVLLTVMFGLSLGFTSMLSPGIAMAQDKCGEVETSIITSDGFEFCENVNSESTSAEDSAIWGVLLEVLNIMTAGIGIVAVGGIVYGALLYTTAGDKPEQTKRAIAIITNVVVGLAAYALMYVLLNYLIPGGIFA